MCKLDLDKAEEPEIKLPTIIGSQKKQENSRKTSTSASLTTLKPLTVWITTNMENSERDGNTRPPDLPPKKSICRSKGKNQKWTLNKRLVPNQKRIGQGCILSPCLFTFYAEYIKRNAGLDEAQAGIKIDGRNISNLRYTDDTTLMGRKLRGT